MGYKLIAAIVLGAVLLSVQLPSGRYDGKATAGACTCGASSSYAQAGVSIKIGNRWVPSVVIARGQWVRLTLSVHHWGNERVLTRAVVYLRDMVRQRSQSKLGPPKYRSTLGRISGLKEFVRFSAQLRLPPGLPLGRHVMTFIVSVGQSRLATNLAVRITVDTTHRR
jgi:hypothetical protein